MTETGTGGHVQEKVIWLHIGANKTGTTALQSYCSIHEATLLERGIFYPRSGRAGVAHHRLGWAFNALGPTVAPAGILQALFEEIDASPAGDVLLSSETFFIKAQVEELASALAGRDVRIVVFLRRQDDWYEMMYKQFVKQPEFRVDTPIGETSAMRLLDSSLDYEAWIGRWADAFGRDRIVCRPYGTQGHGGIDSISALFDLIGKPELASLERPTDAGAVNRSIMEPEFSAVRLSNGIGLKADDRSRLLYHFQRARKRLTAVSSGGQLLDEPERAAMKARYRPGNERLFARFGQAVADGLFPDGPAADPLETAAGAGRSRYFDTAEILSLLWAELRYDVSAFAPVDLVTANALLAECQDDPLPDARARLVVTGLPPATRADDVRAFISCAELFTGHETVVTTVLLDDPELDEALRSGGTRAVLVRDPAAMERHGEAIARESGPVIVVDYAMLPALPWASLSSGLAEEGALCLLDDGQRGAAIAFTAGGDYRRAIGKAGSAQAPDCRTLARDGKAAGLRIIEDMADGVLIDLMTSPAGDTGTARFQSALAGMLEAKDSGRGSEE